MHLQIFLTAHNQEKFRLVVCIQGIFKGPNRCILTAPYFWEARGEESTKSPERICDPLEDTPQAMSRQGQSYHMPFPLKR